MPALGVLDLVWSSAVHAQLIDAMFTQYLLTNADQCRDGLRQDRFSEAQRTNEGNGTRDRSCGAHNDVSINGFRTIGSMNISVATFFQCEETALPSTNIEEEVSSAIISRDRTSQAAEGLRHGTRQSVTEVGIVAASSTFPHGTSASEQPRRHVGKVSYTLYLSRSVMFNKGERLQPFGDSCECLRSPASIWKSLTFVN